MHTPKYRLHARSGRAVVTLTDAKGVRKDYYLGRHGSPASKREYARLLLEWEQTDRRILPATAKERQFIAEASPRGQRVTVQALIDAYIADAEGTVVKNDLDSIRTVLRLVTAEHGDIPAKDFGPNFLRQIRARAVEHGVEGRTWARTYTNRQVRRVVAVWKWGVARELVPAETHARLALIEPLRKGKTAARETVPVGPVSVEHVEATIPHLTPPLRAVVQLQLLTGARGGELLIMRKADIDTTHPSGVWLYRPGQHKTAHLDHDRVIGIGARGQRILMPLLGRPDDAHLFDPSDAPKSRAAPGGRYSASSYRTAIRRACAKAGVPRWHPHQLRHTRTDQIRSRFDGVAASKFVGHSDALITEAVYSSVDIDTIVRVAREVG